MKIRSVLLLQLATVLICVVLFIVLAPERRIPSGAGDTREILTCFVPQEDCTQFVVGAIKLGEHEILVQAYNYTSPPILEALTMAKTKNAVNVRVILDKSNEQERYTGATFTQNHGIPVLIDYRVAIAHSKVMVIDGKHVLTGSFNFTASAQKRNAENVILIKNDPALAKRYSDNWYSRALVSRDYAGPHEKSK